MECFDAVLQCKGWRARGVYALESSSLEFHVSCTSGHARAVCLEYVQLWRGIACVRAHSTYVLVLVFMLASTWQALEHAHKMLTCHLCARCESLARDCQLSCDLYCRYTGICTEGWRTGIPPPPRMINKFNKNNKHVALVKQKYHWNFSYSAHKLRYCSAKISMWNVCFKK